MGIGTQAEKQSSLIINVNVLFLGQSRLQAETPCLTGLVYGGMQGIGLGLPNNKKHVGTAGLREDGKMETDSAHTTIVT